jgi:hypothetical protein
VTSRLAVALTMACCAQRGPAELSSELVSWPSAMPGLAIDETSLDDVLAEFGLSSAFKQLGSPNGWVVDASLANVGDTSAGSCCGD